MSNPDLDLVYRVLHGELEQIPPRDRKHYRWVLRWDMFFWIRELAMPRPSLFWPYVNIEAAARDAECLIGLPVEIRDGVEGIHLEAVR